MKTLFIGFVIFACAAPLAAQVSKSYGPISPTEFVATDPATCTVAQGRLIFNTTSNLHKYCSATNTWSPFAAAAARFENYQWGVCIGTVCTTGADLTAPMIVTQAATLTKCYAAAKTAPTGASLIIDILKSGTSIFGGGTKLVIAATATTGNQATIANASIAESDSFTISITQIGSTIAGQDVSVKCKASY